MPFNFTNSGVEEIENTTKPEINQHLQVKPKTSQSTDRNKTVESLSVKNNKQNNQEHFLDHMCLSPARKKQIHHPTATNYHPQIMNNPPIHPSMRNNKIQKPPIVVLPSHIQSMDSSATKKPKLLKFGTLNMKNFHANKAYLNQLLISYDIVCFQEHWLFEYVKKTLLDFNHGYGTINCVDKLDPLSPYQRVRGYGGCAILWKPEINSCIKQTTEGSKRIACIILSGNSSQAPICVISVYVPSKG